MLTQWPAPVLNREPALAQLLHRSCRCFSPLHSQSPKDTGNQGADDVKPAFAIYGFSEGGEITLLHVFKVFRAEDTGIDSYAEKEHQES